MDWTHEDELNALRAEHDRQLQLIAQWQRRIRGRLERVEELAEKWGTAAAGRAITHIEAAAYIRDALKDPE